MKIANNIQAKIIALSKFPVKERGELLDGFSEESSDSSTKTLSGFAFPCVGLDDEEEGEKLGCFNKKNEMLILRNNVNLSITNKKIICSTRSINGGTGVAFITMELGKILVLKREVQPAPTVLSLMLSDCLKFNNPATRIIKNESKEASLAIKSLVGLEKNHKQYNKSLGYMFSENRGAKWLFVMEMISGSDLRQLTKLTFKNGTLTRRTQRVGFFHDCGKLLSFDLLIHNLDRFPGKGFFDSPGNPGNIMIEDGEKFIGIDHDMFCIPKDDTKKQLDNLRSLISGISDQKYTHAFIKNAINFLGKYIKNNAECKIAFLNGFFTGMEDIGRITDETFLTIGEKIKCFDGHSKCNFEYLKGVRNIFKLVSKQNSKDKVLGEKSTLKKLIESSTIDSIGIALSISKSKNLTLLTKRLEIYSGILTQFIQSKDEGQEKNLIELKKELLEEFLK